SASSATDAAMPSTTARARCARLIPRPRPRNAPRASGRQCGAPSPASAGTNSDPPLSGTLAATTSSSPAPVTRPRSDSQRTAAPAPAPRAGSPWRPSQYGADPPSRQATEADSPDEDRTGAGPVVASRNAPVP